MNGIYYLLFYDVIIKNRDNGIYVTLRKIGMPYITKGLRNDPLKINPDSTHFLFLTQCPIYICNEHQREPVIIDVIGIETQYEEGSACKRDINTIALVVPSQRRKKETIKLTGLMQCPHSTTKNIHLFQNLFKSFLFFI
jgi:hypothetical protein